MYSPDIPNPFSNSSLYPMLLMSLMAQNYTPVTETYFQYEYDYIIVGAGSAGSVLANRLSENPAVTVLVLEAGPSPPPITEVPAVYSSLPNSYLDWRIKSVSQKNLNSRQIPIATGKTVGGGSVLNSMNNVRGNRQNFNDWETIHGAKGWNYRSVLPYFIRLENYTVQGSPFDEIYHGFSGPITVERFAPISELKSIFQKAAESDGIAYVDYNAYVQNGFVDYTLTTRNGRRCSTAKAYLVPADHRQNLHIVTNAFVNKILLEDKTATGVEVDFRCITHNVMARREVILSAGAIHTPQILMLSGIGPREELIKFGIPVVADLPVGKNFHDHALTSLLYFIPKRFLTYEASLQNPANVYQYIKYGTGPLTKPTAIFSGAFLPKDAQKIPDFQYYFLYSDSTEAKHNNKALLSCDVSSLSHRSRGSIKLNSTNPRDPPLVDPNYFDHPQDLEDTIQGVKFCDTFLAGESFRSIGPIEPHVTNDCNRQKSCDRDYYQCIIKSTSESSYHPVGTVKMGRPNSQTTVVDPQLRVKGIQNLRVVDASVMPQVTSGNTNTPTIMIAEKAADLIKNQQFLLFK